jgi:hypothetical protein
MRTNGRDPAGRFGVGNPGGPGRPRRSVEAVYLCSSMSLDVAAAMDDGE